MPNAGRRTEIVTVERETKEADGYGGFSSAWVTVGQFWASVQWVRGGEAERQGAFREIAVYRFRGLTSAIEEIGVSVKDRLVWNGETYNIREKPRQQTRGVDTDVIAETGVTQ